jgi:hypothetical protein
MVTEYVVVVPGLTTILEAEVEPPGLHKNEFTPQELLAVFVIAIVVAPGGQ